MVSTENINYIKDRDNPSQEEQEKLDKEVKNEIISQIKENFYREEIWKKIINDQFNLKQQLKAMKEFLPSKVELEDKSYEDEHEQ